jgi:Pyridoxamine 5'-phosphate oxidase
MSNVDDLKPGPSDEDHTVRPPAGPRTPEQREAEALRRLEQDRDVWVATADRTGVPCMMPLSFWWDGTRVWPATRDTNPTGRNLLDSGLVRLCFGTTRDVVHIEGTAESFTRETVPTEVGDGFASGEWDPRNDHPSYVLFGVTPVRVQAWGTVAEMPDRTLMRDGSWLL